MSSILSSDDDDNGVNSLRRGVGGLPSLFLVTICYRDSHYHAIGLFKIGAWIYVAIGQPRLYLLTIIIIFFALLLFLALLPFRIDFFLRFASIVQGLDVGFVFEDLRMQIVTFVIPIVNGLGGVRMTW